MKANHSPELRTKLFEILIFDHIIMTDHLKHRKPTVIALSIVYIVRRHHPFIESLLTLKISRDPNCEIFFAVRYFRENMV